MDAIGIRVSPKAVTYAIVRGPVDGVFTLVQAGEVRVPLALETPRQLQFVRTALLDIIEEHSVSRAGLRLTEGTAMRVDIFRLNMEGVVQELLASSNVERFVAGRIATIAALLGERDRKIVKKLVEGRKPAYLTAHWDALDERQREAALMAVAAARVPARGRPSP
jgi:hypothetical protein